MNFKFYLTLICTCILTNISSAQEGKINNSAREELSLNGLWDFKSELETAWTQIKVPGNYSVAQTGKWGKHYWDIFVYPKRWTESGGVYKKTILVPKSMEGKYIKLYIGGCHFLYKVFLNGTLVGEANDGYFPYEFLLNPALKTGENEIEIRVSGERHYTSGGESRQSRGIWQDVYLKVYNHLTVEPTLFVKTFFDDKKISCEIPVTNNDTGAHTFAIRNIVLDKSGKEVLSFEAGEHTLQAGEKQVYQAEASWKNPHLWFPHDPYLYHLKTIVLKTSGEIVDEKLTRFGFREVTWEGPHLYINNREIFLRGHGGHYLGDLQGTKDYARQWFRSLKAQGANFMRLHIYPKHSELYEAADEEGFLLEAEPAFHFSVPEDTVLAKEHLEKLIVNQFNHPSIIIWSVSNELRWSGGGEKPFWLKHGKSLDDTRPVFSSDFSAYSTGGDLLGHHYDWQAVWEDWEKHGPDKPMIWDEVASVWQPSRPMNNFTAEYEVSAQDYATGLGYDGKNQMQANLDFVKDGRMINGELYRVNGLVPWDFSYNFFRWQPLGNHKGIAPQWETLEGPGIKATYIKSNASTLNIWDDILPILEPNPGYYLFKDYMQFVRFWDTDKRNTFLSGESFTKTSKLFYEDTRLADEIRLKIQTPKGNVLWEKAVPFEILPGEMKEKISLTFDVPIVDKSTKVKIVRQFYYKGEAGYEHSLMGTVFPRTDKNLTSIGQGKKIVTYGTPAIDEYLKTNGVPTKSLSKLSALKKANPDLLVTTNYESLKSDKHLSKYLQEGGKVLSLYQSDVAGSKNKYPDASRVALGADLVFTEIPEEFKGSTYIMADNADIDFDMSEGKEMDFLTINSNVPVSVYVATDWEAFWSLPWLKKHKFITTDNFLYTNDTDTYLRLYQKDFEAGDIKLGENFSEVKKQRTMYAVVVVPQRVEDKDKLEVSIKKVASGKTYEVIKNGLKFTQRVPDPSITYLLNGAKHKALTGLGQEDFIFTKGTSQITAIEKHTLTGNHRTLLAGDKDGTSIALYEMLVGRGNVISSGIDFSKTFDEAPYAYLFANLLDYQLSYQAATAPKVGLMAGTAWKRKLDALEVQYTDVSAHSGFEGFQQIIIDFTDKTAKSILPSRKAALSDFVEKGGKLLVLDIEQAGLEVLSDISGKPLALTEPFLGETTQCVKAAITWTRRDTPKEWVQYYDSVMVPAPFEWNYDPLLSGISNADLNWEGKSMLDHGIIIKEMDPVFASKDYNILLSNWLIDWSRPKWGWEYTHLAKDERRANWFVNRDPVLLEINKGEGSILLSTLKFREGGMKGTHVLSQLLTNLQIPMGGANQFATLESTFELSAQSKQQERFEHLYYDQPQVRTGQAFDNRYSNQTSQKTDILLIGDTYTAKYFESTSQLLQKFGNVEQLTYEGSSKSLLALLTEKGSAYFKKYETIYFVTGWGDMEKIGDKPKISVEEFEDNLKSILALLRKNPVKLYWGTPLPLPEQQQSHADLVAEYHEVSKAIMVEEGVYVTDIGLFARKALPGFIKGSRLYLTEAESEQVAKQIYAAIRFFGE